MSSSFEKFVFAVDQLEKASERRMKEAAKREKQRQKEQERTDAAQSVANYDQYIAGNNGPHSSKRTISHPPLIRCLD
jgi:hypothetical protein